jgi:hypothetical protein
MIPRFLFLILETNSAADVYELKISVVFESGGLYLT